MCSGIGYGAGSRANLEANSGNITLGVARATESRDEDFVVLIDKVQAAVPRDEGGDLLAVLDELNTHALANGRVRLLRLDAAGEWGIGEARRRKRWEE